MPTVEEVPDLELRRRPTQTRAIATFDLILDTTASLLDTHGFDALTTNLISARSGVSVRAIYRYFPNKHAIVSELARRMGRQWRSALETVDVTDSAVPLSDVWCAYIDTFVAAVGTTHGARAVLSAMRADPELRKADEEANTDYIVDVADLLVSRGGSVTKKDAQAVATVLIRSTVAVLDDAFEADDNEAARLVSVMKKMQLGLLAEYTD